jgi:hypothetical protein
MGIPFFSMAADPEGLAREDVRRVTWFVSD